MKKPTKYILGMLAIVVVIAALAWQGGYLAFNTSGQAGTDSDGQAKVGAEVLASTGNFCGDVNTATVTMNQYNALNETAEETFDSQCYIYKVTSTGTEQLEQSPSDTTAATASLTCGQTYRIKCVSSNSDGGDSGRLMGLRVGDGASLLGDNSGIEFTPNAPTYTLSWNAKHHGVLQFRAKDLINDAMMYDDTDIATTEYETDGINFTGTTNNATATTVGAGGQLKVRLEIQSTKPSTDFSDFGTYILLEAPTATWETPTSMKFTDSNGATRSLENIKGTLDAHESILWSNYEYVYFLPDSILDESVYVELQIKALAGVNPGTDDDIQIDFASKGATKQTVGDTIRQSGSTDASSRAAVYAVQDTNIAVV